MVIDLQLEIPDSTILAMVKAKGYKVVKHDFGRWEKVDHGRSDWHEDYLPAVYIGQFYTIADAFKHLYAYEVRKATLSSINKQFTALYAERG